MALLGLSPIGAALRSCTPPPHGLLGCCVGKNFLLVAGGRFGPRVSPSSGCCSARASGVRGWCLAARGGVASLTCFNGTPDERGLWGRKKHKGDVAGCNVSVAPQFCEVEELVESHSCWCYSLLPNIPFFC